MKSIMSHVFLLLQIITTYLYTHTHHACYNKKVHIHWHYTLFQVVFTTTSEHTLTPLNVTLPDLVNYTNGRKSLLLQHILLSNHLRCISAVNEMHSMARERPNKNTKLLYIDDNMEYYYSLNTGFEMSQRYGMATCILMSIT
jgi:hypothetical protein